MSFCVQGLSWASQRVESLFYDFRSASFFQSPFLGFTGSFIQFRVRKIAHARSRDNVLRRPRSRFSHSSGRQGTNCHLTH